MPVSKSKSTVVKAAKPSAPRRPKVSQSKRAGLTFPIGRIQRLMKTGKFIPRVSMGAVVYMTAVLEYLAAEIIELSGKAATDNQRTRISPRHILLAIKNDYELDKMLEGVTISHGGVIPHIAAQLLPKKTAKKNVSSDNNNGSSQEY